MAFGLNVSIAVQSHSNLCLLETNLQDLSLKLLQAIILAHHETKMGICKPCFTEHNTIPNSP